MNPRYAAVMWFLSLLLAAGAVAGLIWLIGVAVGLAGILTVYGITH